MADPIVVLQMQRLGDVVLSFPLLLWLMRTFPGHPLWLRAEPQFAALARGLVPSGVRLLGPGDDAELCATPAHLVVHLGHSEAGAALAGAIPAQRVLGLVRRGEELRIHGFWQCYRASLVHANRHNRFHWADLHALDAVPMERMAATRWDAPRRPPSDKIGLFLGASTAAKRPDAVFWAGVCGHLRRFGFTPVLLGGPAEKPLAEAVRGLVRRPVLDLCGAFSLERLAYFGQELALLITPDTGPMHVAAWTGLRVLNVSLGPVWPWDTGPYQPGHLVLQAACSCRGCWACTRKAEPCRAPMTPRQVAMVAAAAVQDAPWPCVRGLRLAQTGRDAQGLYLLEPQCGAEPCARELVSRYWRALWLAWGAGGDAASCRAIRQQLWSAFPALARALARESLRLVRWFSSTSPSTPLPWNSFAPALRPLASFLAVNLENEDFSPTSLRHAAELVERHLACFAPEP
jgi:ADP-heptose:LPS heptosyltransferase